MALLHCVRAFRFLPVLGRAPRHRGTPMSNTEFVGGEEWRPVVGWEGLYEVSSYGRVRSLDRVVYRSVGRQTFKGRILKPRWNKRSKYLYVQLVARPRQQSRTVHTVVLEAFVGPRPPGMVACHFNDLFTHNYVENLRWDTASANTYDKVRNGNHPMAKKTHCKHGHPFDEENTGFDRNGHRICRSCQKRSHRNGKQAAK